MSVCVCVYTENDREREKERWRLGGGADREIEHWHHWLDICTCTSLFRARFSKKYEKLLENREEMFFVTGSS